MLKLSVKVENMISNRSGRLVSNQFQIYVNDAVYFQSYRTVIACVHQGKTILDPNWNCSRTTGKYRNQFLGETIKETKNKIKSGEYTIQNLN